MKVIVASLLVLGVVGISPANAAPETTQGTVISTVSGSAGMTP